MAIHETYNTTATLIHIWNGVYANSKASLNGLLKSNLCAWHGTKQLRWLICIHFVLLLATANIRRIYRTVSRELQIYIPICRWCHWTVTRFVAFSATTPTTPTFVLPVNQIRLLRYPDEMGKHNSRKPHNSRRLEKLSTMHIFESEYEVHFYFRRFEIFIRVGVNG